MTDPAIILPENLAQWSFGFVLVLARIAAAVMLLPGLGESAPPPMVRAGIALCLTFLLLPGLLGAVPAVPEAGGQAAGMVAAEVVTGLWFGWLARLIVLALPVAAQFIAYMLGLSSVLLPDAEMGPQTTALAKLFELAAPVLILVSGLYTLPLTALDGSYRLIPPGSLIPAADSALVAVRSLTQAFELALRLAAPFVLAAILWNAAAGLAARLVPRLQIFFLAMPGQILGGLLLLAGLSGALVSAWQEAVSRAFQALPGS